MTNLALVPSKRLVSASEAARLLANYKTKKSWCVDVSGNFPILMHGLSDQTATVQDIRLQFTGWANTQGIRVDCPNYALFLASLPDPIHPS